MARSAILLLSDPVLHRHMADTACTRVQEHFCVDLVVPMYERYYEQIRG
jgi:hypothetical protein